MRRAVSQHSYKLVFIRPVNVKCEIVLFAHCISRFVVNRLVPLDQAHQDITGELCFVEGHQADGYAFGLGSGYFY